MKRLMLSLLMLVTTVATQAQTGRVQISFVGFECYLETWDDILHSDGKGDVYFNFGFALADKNGNTIQKYEKRTIVYGDATGQFSNRISAGSWVNIFGEEKGGIKAGDLYHISRGTCNYNNDLISGLFKQLSSGEPYSFNAIINPSTNQIFCTQGQGTSISGQGKWVVLKIDS